MSVQVWMEWQACYATDPWGEERGDLRAGILAQALYDAIYRAVGRVIGSLVGEDAFPYEKLPKAHQFMPYRDRSGDEDADDDEPLAPLDPNAMTERDWAVMASEMAAWGGTMFGVAPPVG